MDDPRNRLIDTLLEEELGDAAPPDLADRVLARAFPAKRWRLPLPWLVAAAAALLAVLGVAQLWLWPHYPEPSATGSYELVAGDAVGRGAILRTTDQPAELALGGYGQVEIRPGSIVRIDGQPFAEAIYLEAGEVICDVGTGVGSFAVNSPAGSVQVTGTRFTVQVLHKGEQPMRSMIVRVLMGAVVLVTAETTIQLVAGQEKKAEEKGGTVVGVVTAKGDNFLEVKGDGELKARRYVPEWVGGAPAQGGGFNKEMVKTIGKITVGSRVRLEWKFEERPRVVKVEVIKSEDKK